MTVTCPWARRRALSGASRPDGDRRGTVRVVAAITPPPASAGHSLPDKRIATNRGRRRRGRSSLSLRDTISAPAEIKARQPDFRYSLVDLGPIPDLDLSAYPPLRAGLLALKYSQRESDPETVLVQVFSDAKDRPPLFRMLVVYATAVYRAVTPATLRMVIRRVRPEWEEEMLSIAAKEWMAEGAKKGHDEGRKKGHDEGRKKGLDEGLKKGRGEMLLRQLRRKFGEVSANAAERVSAAGIDQLDEWGERVLDAESLDEVFAEARPH